MTRAVAWARTSSLDEWNAPSPVTWLYFQAFALLAYRRRGKPGYAPRSRAFWAVPVLLYLAAGLAHIPPLLAPDARLVDAGGRAWSAADLRETAVIVMLATMAPTSLLALLRLATVSQPERESL